MTMPEMMGCFCSIIGLCIGIGTGVILEFGFLGGIVGGVIGYLLGWYFGIGIAHLIILYSKDPDQKSEKSSKDNAVE